MPVAPSRLTRPQYKRDGVVLYQGDCRLIVPGLDAIDHIITDPPYGDGATHNGHLGKVVLRNGEPAGRALGFAGISLGECVELVGAWVALAKRWVVFTCEWKYAHALDDAGLLVRLGIWRKPDGAPQFTGDRPGTGWEAVAICHRPGKKRWNGGGKHAFWEYPKGENPNGHPAGKPLELLRRLLLDFTDPGETVLDPFMGRGTTGVACVATGRRFTGVEIDPVHYQSAEKRIERAIQYPHCEDRFARQQNSDIARRLKSMEGA